MKGLYRIVASLLLVTMLSSCATAYQKSGITGGYGETKIDDTHYVVYFNGNGYASKDRVWDFWIYRCAQLTVEKGYAYFSLTPVLSNMNQKTSFDPDESGRAYAAVLIGDANGHVINVHGGGGGGGGFIYVPGGGRTIVTWHSKAIVTMYGNDVPQKTFVVRAQSVLDMLGEYIKTNGSSVPPDRTSIAYEATYAVAPDNTVVNVHHYLLTHVHPTTATAPYAYAAPSDTVQPARNNVALPSPPAPLPPASVTAQATSAPATAPVTALDAETAALNARPSLAQSVARQLGCGAIRDNGDSTYIASCGSYSVVISCDGDQCRPMHTINAKSND
jgi:hypothetical protein